MMKTILLMRHAKSSWGDKVKDDWDRPLSKRGKKNIPEMTQLLKEKEVIPQVILASAATRARETGELLVHELRYRGDVQYLSSLYMGEQDTYLKEINQLPDAVDCALVIGHNPGLEMLFQMLSGRVESLPTTAIACFQVPIDTWKELDYDCKFEAIHLWKIKD